MTTYREHSRTNWRPANDDIPTLEQVNVGSLQRIADAVEKMAASYDQMRSQRDYWESRAKEERAVAERLARSNKALRGAITRAKNKLNHQAPAPCS